MPSSNVEINGVTFEVWETSFRVVKPFYGSVVFVGAMNRDRAMEGVSETVVAAYHHQHKKTQALVRLMLDGGLEEQP